MSLLRWTSKSSTKLADELVRQGYEVSPRTVLRLLHQLGYSLQANAKVTEGRQHPDRDGQFGYLNEMAASFHADGQPVISTDTKKKELIGDYKNGGQEWSPGGEPERVQVHDFADRASANGAKPSLMAFMTWPTTRAGSRSAMSPTPPSSPSKRSESGGPKWAGTGSLRHERLLITADAGGSNGYRLRAWKYHLARLAAETGLDITCCHYPPGTSKWNRIEHRMFSFITMNWRGRPLTSLRTIIELISATATTTGPDSSSEPTMTGTGIRPAARSRTRSWPQFLSNRTNSTASGTTQSPLNQSRREPLARRNSCRTLSRFVHFRTLSTCLVRPVRSGPQTSLGLVISSVVKCRGPSDGRSSRRARAEDFRPPSRAHNESRAGAKAINFVLLGTTGG